MERAADVRSRKSTEVSTRELFERDLPVVVVDVTDESTDVAFDEA